MDTWNSKSGLAAIFRADLDFTATLVRARCQRFSYPCLNERLSKTHHRAFYYLCSVKTHLHFIGASRYTPAAAAAAAQQLNPRAAVQALTLAANTVAKALQWSSEIAASNVLTANGVQMNKQHALMRRHTLDDLYSAVPINARNERVIPKTLRFRKSQVSCAEYCGTFENHFHTFF